MMEAMLFDAIERIRKLEREVAELRALISAEEPRDAPLPEPPCGGTHCHRADDGTWIHSSKSYGACSVRNAKPKDTAGPCKTCGCDENGPAAACAADGLWHDRGRAR